jgi:diamine N-acetyltransferase
METTFRIAGVDDIPLLMEMIRSFYREDHHDFQEIKIQKALREILSEREIGSVYMIDSDQNTAGYFIISFGWSLEYFGKDIFIDELFIREGCRRLGLGKKSLEFIERFVKENNFKAIHLEVNKFNIARKLYESKGYLSHNSDLMSKRF